MTKPTDPAVTPVTSDAGDVTVTRDAKRPLTGAERQRAYRERQRERRAQQTQDAPANAPSTSTVEGLVVAFPTTNRSSAHKAAAKAERATRHQELKAQADKAATTPAPPIKRRPGAPSMYTEELGIEICERIAAREALAKICEDEHMPCERQIYIWVQKHPEFAQRLARARQERAAARAERIDALVEMLTAGKLAPDAARVAIQAEQWQAGKEQPSVYGDKVQADITSGGKSLAPSSDLDIAKALAHALQARALPAPEPVALDVEAVPVEPEGEQT
jgi:hypothetical protein